MYKYQEYIEEWNNLGEPWSRLIPYKGATIHPADLNTIQSILNHQVGNVLGSIYKNGTVVKGADIIIRNNICEVTPGIFYLDGILIDIPSKSFSINPLENYVLYLHIDNNRSFLNTETISQSSSRNLILTPSLGTEVISITSRVEINNPSLYVLGNITLGIGVTNKTNLMSPISSLLALSNYERYGNFIVKGLQPSVLNNTTVYSSNNSLPVSVIDAHSIYIRNLEEALRNSIQAQTLIGNQLSLTINRFNTSNSVLVGNDINLLRTSFETASRNVQFFRIELKKAYDNLSTNTHTISKFIKDTITISPGVVYIEGYRVNIPSVTSILVERDLTEHLIENVKYEVNDTDNKVYRSLDLIDTYSFEDLLTLNTEIYISVENLSLNGKRGSGKVVCAVNYALPDYITSIQLLLDFIVSEIMFTPYNHMNIRFESTGGNIHSGSAIRNAIVKAIEIERINFNTLAINSIETSVITLITTTNSSILNWDKELSYLGNALTNSNYTLSFTPVTRIKSLIADMQRKNEPIIRGLNDKDTLPDGTVFDINLVTQGGIKYIKGIDYMLIGSNTIKWLYVTYPANGTLYYVTYTFTQPLRENEDFILSKLDNSIRFVNRVPSGGSFTLDYYYALNKRGYVYIDINGNFSTQVYNLNTEGFPSNTSSSMLLTTFDITTQGIFLLPTHINRIITPELVSLLEERIRVLEDDISQLMLGLTTKQDSNAIYTNIQNFLSTTLNPADKYNYNILLGGITPINKAITKPLSYTSGGYEYSDKLFGTKSKYVSLLSSPLLNQFSTEDYSSSLKILPINTLNKQPVMLFSIDRVTLLNPLESNLSLLDSYPLTIIKDTYTVGSSIYLDTIYKNFTKQVGKFLSTIKDSIEYGAFNTLLLPSSYFMDSFLSQYKVSGITLNLIVINITSGIKNIGIKLNGNSINDRTIPLGNTVKNLNNLLESDLNNNLTIQIQLPVLGIGTHVIDIVQGNDVIASNTLIVPPNLLISAITQGITSWNQVIDINLSNVHTISSKSVGTIVTINPNIQAPLDQDFIYASDESLIQFFSPTQDLIIDGITLNIKDFDPRVRIVGVIKEAIVDTEYHIDSYRTTENIIGLLTSKTINTGGEVSQFLLTAPTPLYKGNTYAICLYVYNSWIDIGTYNIQYPLPNLILKGLISRSNSERNVYSLSNNIQLDLILLTYNSNVQQDIVLGNYSIENGDVPITHFCINTYPMLPSGTSVLFQYYNGSEWKSCFINQIVSLAVTLSVLQVRALCKTFHELTSPIISLDESSVTLFTLDSSILYTSNIITIDKLYTQVDVVIDYMYDPEVIYEVELGNALGNSWLDMSIVPTSLINLDTSGLFKQVRFTYVFPTTGSPLKSFMYRLKAFTSNLTRTPCIKQAVIYVYP